MENSRKRYLEWTFFLPWAMADIQFKFVSHTKLVLKTTGFTRIRLPVVVKEQKGQNEINTERIVFMTSKMTVDVHSGGKVHGYVVDYGFDGSRFRVPEELNVKSLAFTPKLFDAEIPVKKFSR